jgi:ABC-2 type transport system permease protein
MNVFIHELKSYRKSTIIWTLSLCALAVIFLLMYPAFTKDVAASRKALAGLPPVFREAVGISLANFFTIFGFYAYLLNFLMLAAAIQAINLGVGVISKEESGKTADFLLSKPVSRASVITSKLLAVLSLLLMTNVVFVSVSLVAARLISPDPFSSKILLLIASTVFLVQLAFLALGALFSVIIPRVKSVIAVSIPTVFVFFIIGALGAVLSEANTRYLTPFKYFDSNYIITHGTYETRFLVIEAVLVAIAISATYVIFIKKDIRAAS